jgi:hypothetical protein
VLNLKGRFQFQPEHWVVVGLSLFCLYCALPNLWLEYVLKTNGGITTVRVVGSKERAGCADGFIEPWRFAPSPSVNTRQSYLGPRYPVCYENIINYSFEANGKVFSGQELVSRKTYFALRDSPDLTLRFWKANPLFATVEPAENIYRYLMLLPVAFLLLGFAFFGAQKEKWTDQYDAANMRRLQNWRLWWR